MNKTNLPQSIQATIHQDALSRVPSFFAATLEDIANELFQNARRSGATRVDVTINEDSITIADNGKGIQDPRVLLAFGQSTWNSPAVNNEHPAGMGFYSLARRPWVRVQSRTGDNIPWSLELTPEHFTGEKSAPVLTLQSKDPMPAGTSITFKWATEYGPEGIIAECAQYFPLPVFCNGAELPRLDFLDKALYVEEYQGTRIGVYRSPARDWRTSNFHGIVLKNTCFASVKTLQEEWSAAIDVVNCPHLELTLPSRKSLVATPFTDELKRAARAVVYRAMLREPDPVEVPYEVQQDAKQLGIDLPDPVSALLRWEPETADGGTTGYYGFHDSRKEAVNENTLLVGIQDGCAPDQQALGRAANRNGMNRNLMQANYRLKGYPWYDALPVIEEVEIEVTLKGKVYNLSEVRKEFNTSAAKYREWIEVFARQRPEKIELLLQMTSPTRGKWVEKLPADYALLEDELQYYDEATPLVTEESSMSVNELADILMASCYCYDEEGDHYETQQKEQENRYGKIARQTLQSEEDAIRHGIITAAQDHLRWEVPPDMTATLKVTHSTVEILNLERNETN